MPEPPRTLLQDSYILTYLLYVRYLLGPASALFDLLFQLTLAHGGFSFTFGEFMLLGISFVGISEAKIEVYQRKSTCFG